MASDGVTQRILAGFHDEVPGDCMRAGFATLLGLPLDAVPHFALFGQYWLAAIHTWLSTRGLTLDITDDETWPTDRCIVAGPSPRGHGHVVLAQDGHVVWDPHPSRAGLVAVEEHWRVRFKAANDGG